MQRTIDLVADIALDHHLVVTMMKLAQDLYDAVALTLIEFSQAPGEPTRFDYRIDALDGRVWQQEVTFLSWPAQDADPPMTFDVPQGWRRLSEFEHQRDLRTHLIAMVNKSGLTRLEIVWS